MSFQTLEVELENGQVRPQQAETLPAKARALLTILAESPSDPASAAGDSLADRVAHLRGIGRGEYTDFSTNKRHLNDFGQ